MDMTEPSEGQLGRYAAAALIQLSTCGEAPRQSLPPSVPARTKNLIAELGLRYRPASQADLQAHAATLGLLARDLAHVPPGDLEIAIQRHVLRSPYLPKASDLVDVAEAVAAERRLRDRPAESPPAFLQEERFDETRRCTPGEAAAILAEFRLTGVSVQRAVPTGPLRMPTAADLAEIARDMGL